MRRVVAFKSCTVCFEIWDKACLSLSLCGCCKPLSKSDRISKLLKTEYVFCSELVWPKSFIRKLIMVLFSTNDINCCCLHGKALNGFLRTRSFQGTQLSQRCFLYSFMHLYYYQGSFIYNSISICPQYLIMMYMQHKGYQFTFTDPWIDPFLTWGHVSFTARRASFSAVRRFLHLKGNRIRVSQ